MPTKSEHRYLVVGDDLVGIGFIDDERLAALTERHRLEVEVLEQELGAAPLQLVKRDGHAGIVLRLESGLPSRSLLRLMSESLGHGVATLAWWPAEQSLEVVDAERLRSYRWHSRAQTALELARRMNRALYRLITVMRLRGIYNRLRRLLSLAVPIYRVARGGPVRWAFSSPRDEVMPRLTGVNTAAAPVPLPCPSLSEGIPRVEGVGVYLRLDFWAAITSGGSYGHTCYVAKNLARTSDSLLCFMARRYELLDSMGLRQVVPLCEDADSNESSLVAASERYFYALHAALEVVRPAYIYERICLGNWAGAALSQSLGIPYIVEYNGSEISMNRSFGGSRLEFEDVFELAERAAFRQASLVSVVSEPIRESLVKLGVAEHKILVNPNGADPEIYSPPAPAVRASLRSSLGFTEGDRVIGFTGTFGGWHGIDVLAEAVPRVCAEVPEARFLFIGDGSFKHLVDDAVRANGLGERCVSVGRVPQHEGARLLGACDIFVSPHNAHMVDSRFFGSPTKLFEYMSMAGGIVASNLEQLGEVLSPALPPDGLGDDTDSGDARAVLCEPGDVDAFVRAVIALARSPALCARLGANARQAVLDHYTWERHVQKLWSYALEAGLCSQPERERPQAEEQLEVPVISTGDAYKDEVQQQWNVDACGSHYVEGVPRHTLEWYLEAERYRYQEYAPWMHETMEFAMHDGEDLLEVGAGMGTDLAQFAIHGARTTDLDLSGGHLAHARENFRLRGLEGRFVHQDAEVMPFDDDSFDVVYSNGVIHHTPNTAQVIDEIWRVLRPGGRAIIMVYAENSLHYWRNLFFEIGFRQGWLEKVSMGDIMSRTVELSSVSQKPLVKVYTPQRLRTMFSRFCDVEVVQRQLMRAELPRGFGWMDPEAVGKRMGWNLIVKARKPANG